MTSPVDVLVVGSVNLDLVATGERLPSPGETVTGASLARHPGGKGANQALAARRLGARTRLLARVGRDTAAAESLALLREGGVDLSGVSVDEQAATGVALIAVAASGENQIIVAPGANATFGADLLTVARADVIICQLELPIATVERVAAIAQGFLCLNLAPACPLSAATLTRVDLIIVNDNEAEFYGRSLHALPALLAITHGARGATLWSQGRELVDVTAPRVTALDTTGAGDAFVAALAISLVEGQSHHAALRFACAAGALSAARAGAQPSLPLRAEIETLLQDTRV